MYFTCACPYKIDQPMKTIMFLQFIRQEAIQDYSSSLLEWAANMLSKTIGEPCLPVPKDMTPPYMAVIRFPMELQSTVGETIGECTLYDECNTHKFYM